MDIYYQNVRGIRTKTNELYKSILQSDYKVIILTETWLNSSIYNSEFIDDRYIVYRRDRDSSSNTKRDGGGVLIAVSRDIESVRVQNWESECEDLWVKLTLNSANSPRHIFVCAIYLPPPVKVDALTTFLNNVNDNALNGDNDVVILGDFNLNFISWEDKHNESYTIPINYNSNLGYTFVDFISYNNLYQYNNICNCDNRKLDLILSNIPKASVTLPLELLSKLDQKHPNLLFHLPLNNLKYLHPKPRTDYNFFKADYCNMITELNSYDWDAAMHGCEDVEQMISLFYDNLNKAMGKFVPKRTKKSSKFPRWYSVALIKLIKEQHKARMNYRKFNNPRDKLEYDLLRSRCHKLSDFCYSKYKRQIESNLQINPKSFWTYIRDKRNNDSNLPSQMHLADSTAKTGPEVANLFASHFSSTYLANSADDVTQIPEQFNNRSIAQIKISEKDIYFKINQLDIFKGSGPDGIPPLLIKRCSQSLTYPLFIIFNKSLETGQFPDIWKKARILPLHKKGDSCIITNYRPISILCCFSKLFESLICPIITQHIDIAISDFQHGFRMGRSAETNLVSFISDISKEVDSGYQVDTIYTDFSSAFDKVSHSLLIAKLEANGVHGSLLNWFKSYLERRSQLVSMNGHESRLYYADSGVPQGSHLGPILFSLFINDIVTKLQNSKCSLFADDLKIFKTVNCLTDASLLQSDLSKVQQWCTENFMVLNSQKCYHIKFTRKKMPIPSVYKVGDDVLNEVNEVKDLGVTLDAKLTFIPHINNITKKAAQMMGFIRRNSNGFSVQSKILLYDSLVRSHLEYSSSAWNPSYALHSQHIESIQRSFTRHLAFISSGISHRCPYEQRLSFFNMVSLKSRRTLRDLTFLHKVMNGNILCSDILERVFLTVPYNYPRQPISKILHGPIGKTNLLSHSPINRMCQSYTNLLSKDPDIDMFSNSLNIFKSYARKVNC